MCRQRATGAFDRGLAEVRAGRRTLLQAGGAGLVFSAATSGPDLASARPGTAKRAYVLVIDGCRPDEIDSGLTPRLHELRDGGLHFPRASSMPVAETIPNHVMMMTGMRPDVTGVPANAIYDRDEQVVRDLDRASDIRVETVIERLNRRGFRTGTVLSKEYLYGIFGARATYRWEPKPIVPVSGHAPDLFTMRAALEMLDRHDPHLMFVNLGDIDRFGHVDLTGGSLRLLRRTALVGTDRLVGQFVDRLKETGRWESSIVIVLADHAMDWSTPGHVVSLQPVLEADPFLAGRFQIADNGGADLIYWTGPPSERSRAVARIQQLAGPVPGVLSVLDRTRRSLRLGPEAGDVVAYCQAGWRFSDPDLTSNPIPGNHGHPATRSIPFFIGGGHRVVPRGVASPDHARTVDVGPTVARFFRAGRPKRGFDGRSRL